ncbi:MAG: hypothetical protein AAFS10_02665 [Myxococcota bacterium]
MSDDTRWQQVAPDVPIWSCTYRIPRLICRSFAVQLNDGRFLVGTILEDRDLVQRATQLVQARL